MDRPPHRFDRFHRRAAEITRSPEELRRLLGATAAKADRAGRFSARLATARGELNAFIGLLGAWARGEYPEVSTRALVMVAAAVLYFLAPLDAVPDFILGLGLIDDVAVIGYVLGAVRKEIAAFERWRREQEQGTAEVSSLGTDGGSPRGDAASPSGDGASPEGDAAEVQPALEDSDR